MITIKITHNALYPSPYNTIPSTMPTIATTVPIPNDTHPNILFLRASILEFAASSCACSICFLSHKPLPLYLSILINYIIPYFYTNVKSGLYHLCDTLVSDLFFPCFIPLYQGSSPVGRCLSSDRLQVWNYAFFGHKKRPGNGFSVTRSGDLLWNCSKRGENAPKNAKMMVYKKRLIDHHTWLPLLGSNQRHHD